MNAHVMSLPQKSREQGRPIIIFRKRMTAVNGVSDGIVAVCLSAKNRFETVFGNVTVLAAGNSENSIRIANGDVLSLALADASSSVEKSGGSVFSGAMFEARSKSGGPENCACAIAVSGMFSSVEAEAAECAGAVSSLVSICEARKISRLAFSIGGLLSFTNIGKATAIAASFAVCALAAWNVATESMKGIAVSIGALGINDMGKMSGFAFSTGANLFDEFSGFCMGPVNVCKKGFRGVMLGLVNVDKSAKRFKCVPFIRVRLGNRESIKTDAPK
jgi:hypothetical protein